MSESADRHNEARSGKRVIAIFAFLFLLVAIIIMSAGYWTPMIVKEKEMPASEEKVSPPTTPSLEPSSEPRGN